jgi:hypothetical protein
VEQMGVSYKAARYILYSSRLEGFVLNSSRNVVDGNAFDLLKL